MYTSDEQILKLPAILLRDKKISSLGQFHEETGISKQQFGNIKNQERTGKPYHFTAHNIEKISNLYDINYNFIFATSEEVYNTRSSTKKAQTT